MNLAPEFASSTWGVAHDESRRFGQPRTATTLLYQALCVSACLLFGDEIDCFFGDKMRTLRRFKRPTVLKVHDVSSGIELTRFETQSPWWFLTAGKNSSSPEVHGQDFARRHHVNVRYVQPLDALGTRGYYLVKDLETILAMTVHQIDLVLDYMRYWHVLRRCCGAQMSHDFRQRLLGESPSLRDPASPDFDACEIYNVGQVERFLIKTPVFRKCAAVDAVQRLSVVDGRLNGTYCERANALAKTRPTFGKLDYVTTLDPNIELTDGFNRRRPGHVEPWMLTERQKNLGARKRLQKGGRKAGRPEVSQA